jgi:hypothetical protein
MEMGEENAIKRAKSFMTITNKHPENGKDEL